MQPLTDIQEFTGNAEQPAMPKGYLSTAQLRDRFDVSSRTIHRWMKKDRNPLPQPRMKPSGSHNLWAIEDVEAWEQREAELVGNGPHQNQQAA